MSKSKKTLGLVTFSNNGNFGGALQEYALYTVLKDDYNAKCIYYDDPLIRANSAPVRYGLLVAARMMLKGQMGSGADKKEGGGKSSFLSYALKEGINQLGVTLGDLIHLCNRLKMVRTYNSFFETQLNRTPKYSLKDITGGAHEKFDVLISGSDQIWNPKKFGLSDVYFLNFDKGLSKKISYASSFGNFDFPDGDFTRKIGAFLSEYAAVSVREAGAVQMLREKYGIQAQLTLDPTLLLSKSEWAKSLNLEKTSEGKEKYLLVYSLANHKNILDYAKKAAKKLGLKVYVIGYRRTLDFDGSTKYLPTAGPREFVELIMNASMVVTNSFHATAFSLNFNTPFYTVASLVPDRLTSLLGMTGMTDRLLPFTPEMNDAFTGKVDFEASNRILAEQRAHSLAYLEAAINS